MRHRSVVTSLVGWLASGVVYFLAVLPLMPVPAHRLFAFKMGWAVGGFLASSVLAWVYGHRLVQEQPRIRLVPIAAIASVLLGGAWVSVVGGLAVLAFGSTNLLFTPTNLPFVAMNHICVLLAWSGGYFALQSWREVAQRERLLAEAALSAKEAHLEMLRYQLNPHFLFNALTSLRALVTEDPGAAKRVIGELAGFLRATLDGSAGAVTSLQAELSLMERYLSIERIRFEDRLKATVDCHPAIRNMKVPSFILHPLVENAINHADPLGDGSIHVDISARAVEGGAEVEIANPGRLNPDDQRGSGHRIGLRNVRARLAAIAPGQSHLTLIEEDGWVRARISLRTEEGRHGA